MSALADLLSLGSHGAYVVGAYLVGALVLAAECIEVALRRRNVLASLGGPGEGASPE